jgi:hypothetical protein
VANDGTFSADINQVFEMFVNDDLGRSVGEICNAAKVSTGTVHHTLAFLIAEDIIYNAKNIPDAMVALISMQQFMYQIISTGMLTKAKKGLQ